MCFLMQDAQGPSSSSTHVMILALAPDNTSWEVTEDQSREELGLGWETCLTPPGGGDWLGHGATISPHLPLHLKLTS